MMEVLALLSVVVFIAGLIALIQPLARLGIPNRKRALLVLAGSFAVFLFAVINYTPSESNRASGSASTTATAGSIAAEPAVAAVPSIPPEETAFMKAVQAGKDAFNSAANEMAQGGVRAARKSAICAALASTEVKDWVGKISELSSNSDGKGVLAVTIADDVSVGTWNNEFSDIEHHTLIEPNSALFAVVSKMKTGDDVIFSGRFFGNGVDCVREQSLTLRGSLTEPEFVFRFESVRAQ